ncbi:MAG: hypothetical protein N2446_02070 [Elusimicrobiales bacterium]|nr:hypothetical protein [Elusimicrobiales bacterium]
MIIIFCGLLALNFVGYQNFSPEFIKDLNRMIKNYNVKKVLILPLRKNGYIEKHEVKYIQDSFLKSITSFSDIEIIEPIAYNENATDIDLIIAGDLYKKFDEFELFIKLIEPKSKSIIKVLKSNFPKVVFEEELFKIDFQELQNFNNMFLEEINFRYSISDDCQVLIKNISEIQKQNIDLKARYIVWKFKQNSNFLNEIRRNPGSELIDEESKEKFFLILKKYWNNDIVLSDMEIKKINEIISKEEEVFNQCGWR